MLEKIVKRQQGLLIGSLLQAVTKNGLKNVKVLSGSSSHASLTYRNRSLKQFFGDIKALDCKKVSDQYANDKKKHVVCKATNKNDGMIRGGKKQKSSFQVSKDEYLINKGSKEHKKEKGGLRAFQKDQTKIKMQRQNLQTEQKQVVRNGRYKPQNEKYNPHIYDWRKSLSKDKKQPQTQTIVGNRSLVIESQYFPSYASSHLKVGPVKAKAEPVKRIKSNYSKSLGQEQIRLQLGIGKNKSQKNKSSMKPKVNPHIFESRSPKHRHEMAKSKSLLFTFGLSVV